MPPEKRKLIIHCPAACSLNPDKIGLEKAEILRVMRENGAGQKIFVRRGSELLGRQLQSSSVSRHFAHYREVDPAPPVASSGVRISEVGVLDEIVRRGIANSANWKPTLRDVMEAMKLKMSMTGASAFEDMLTAMDAGLDLAEDEEVLPESVEAVFSADERPTDDAEELSEPVY